jgi:hypothetical protein
MAYQDLKNAMQSKKFLHGHDVRPIIELRSTWWKPKQFARRKRADFYPVNWVHVSADGGMRLVEELQLEKPPTAKQIAAPAKQTPTSEQALNDQIPF